MRLKRDFGSKTLWLQVGIVALAAASEELLHLVKERPLVWIAAHAALTAAARMIQVRRPCTPRAKLKVIRRA